MLQAKRTRRRWRSCTANLSGRAQERFAREQAEHQQELAARVQEAKTASKKPGGRPPTPSPAGARPTDQINLTDEDSRIMPVARGGFERCYDAQAAVAVGHLLVVASDVVQVPRTGGRLSRS